VVFGMPKEAIKLGAVDQVMPLEGIASAITQFDARG
jgi:two-component system chemotaxis response regulator CheB